MPLISAPGREAETGKVIFSYIFETAWATSESATKRKTENKNGKRGVEQE